MTLTTKRIYAFSTIVSLITHSFFISKKRRLLFAFFILYTPPALNTYRRSGKILAKIFVGSLNMRQLFCTGGNTVFNDTCYRVTSPFFYGQRKAQQSDGTEPTIEPVVTT
jgi:hypothetical protein